MKFHISCQVSANRWRQGGFMQPPFKFVWERFPTAIKTDRIHLFDVSRHRHGYGVIGRSMFDVHKFPFFDQTGCCFGRRRG